MTQALVIGASGGIGSALSGQLERAGAEVTKLSRTANGLDITDPGSVDHHLGALSGPFDLILIASGALQINGAGPEKSLRQIDADAMADQFATNASGPALILKHAPTLLPRDRRAVVAALSARVGSIGDNRLGGWYSYRAAKAALNQIIHTAAIEVARTHPQAIIAALHPGTVATPFTARFVKPENATPPETAAAGLLDVINQLTPGDSGGFFDYAGKRIQW